MAQERVKKVNAKLAMWQERLARSNQAFGDETARMDEREKLYNGDNELKPLVVGDAHKDGRWKRTSHVRNIVFENIESQVSSSIPKPKVTPRRKKDEHLAEVIEHFLRNELDRLPFETMNDMAERTVLIQGGVGFLVQWDNSKSTHSTVGEVDVSVIHPKQFAPQPGVYTGIEDMDWFIIKIPTTKEAVRRKYGVDVSLESEEDPAVRSPEGADVTDDAVTENVGYERNSSGGIDLYAWVNDVELEDLENYQARRQPVCARCGRVRPLPGQIISAERIEPPVQADAMQAAAEQARRMVAGRALASALAGAAPEGPEMPGGPGGMGAMNAIPVKAEEPEPVKYDGGPCPWCGSTEFTSEIQEYEQIMLPVQTAGGLTVEGAVPALDENGMPVLKPTMVPFYRPDTFPIVLQKSVSVYGQLLGNSDVDVIRDQQNTVNRMEQKIIDRLVKAGTRITLPDKPELRTDPEDGERWYIGNASDKAVIGLYDFSGDLQYELMYLANVYEEARQILGITDSFQGRTDTTATSGKAKEFSAAQAAGRLESKRVMKNAAYAAIFEMMFKNWLAYGDEPRPVSYKNFKGETEYQEFRRYDFLEKDADGQWYWNDQFLFSVDTSEPLASNREAMWQETRLNLQTGAFGDPSQTDTLILFWEKMEELHYPGAGATKKFLEERREREQAQMMQQMQMQQAMLQAQQAQAQATGGGQQIPPELRQAVEQRARQDAMAAARGQGAAGQRGGQGVGV